MAKRKKLNVKRHLPKQEKKKSGDRTPRKDVALMKDVKAIQAKYEKPIKSPVREIGKVKKELKDLRSPLYKLRSKFKKETRKTYADKLRKEIKAYENKIAPKIEHLVEKREDAKTLQKQFKAIREEKSKKRSKIRAIDRKIYKAEENDDWKTVEKLTYEKIKELGGIDSLNESLGMPIFRPDLEEYEADDEADERGYLEDAANPLTIWEAINKFNDDMSSGTWEYMIINGKRFAIQGNRIMLSSEASSFWLSLKQKNTGTPHVLRFFNITKKTVKYSAYKM